MAAAGARAAETSDAHHQHEHGAQPAASQHQHEPAAAKPAPADAHAGHAGMAGMEGAEGEHAMTMMAGAAGPYIMMRDASGTSWQPDSSPMDGVHFRSGGWTGMVHGFVNLVYDNQGGPRGETKTFSESMLMVMGQHDLGPGRLTLKSMVSLDPAMGKDGYPLLLQTGETADGAEGLVDRQHPHDFFMELAALYSFPLGGDGTTGFLYAGYPGEPALGPPAFMHRASGMDSPAAPISHHWLDSTHITYGVVTAGVVRGPLKLEASVFTGREPDQFRWGFDKPRMDSFSGRISFNPTPDWAFQVSYGSLKAPEQLEPDTDQRRITASVIYNRKLAGGNWQTTFAWGRNDLQPGPVLDAFLLESAVTLGRHTVFGRVENAQKNELFEPPSPLAGRTFRVTAFNLGYVYDIPVGKHLALGLGATGSAYALPAAIKPAYGDSPLSYMAFARLKLR